MKWKCSKCGYAYLHFDGNGGYVCTNCKFYFHG